MAKRGICVRTESINQVNSALIRNGYVSQKALTPAISRAVTQSPATGD